MSTFEAPAVEGAILRRIHDMLVDAMAEAGRILAGAGASPEEMLKMTVPFLPLMRLLRDSLEVRTGAPPPHPGPADLEGSALLRSALIRLLWREVADGGGCVCEADAAPASSGATWDRTLTDTCEAMRALGWGQHWDAAAFQRNAIVPTPEAIETGFLDRGSIASNVVSILRRR